MLILSGRAVSELSGICLKAQPTPCALTSGPDGLASLWPSCTNDPKKCALTHALSAARPRARPGHGGPGGHRERAGAAPTVHSLSLRDEKRLLAVGRGARVVAHASAPRLTLS